MKNATRPLLCLVLTSLLAGCASVSSYQTARALPRGAERTILGVGYFHSPVQVSLDDRRLEPSEFILVEGVYRVGLGGGFEIGGRATFPSSLGLDGKYQFVDEQAFAMAVGVSLGYLGAIRDAGTSRRVLTQGFVEMGVPVILSYDFSPSFSLYLSPRYWMRFMLGADSSFAQLAGTGAGVRIGRDYGIFLEGTYLAGVSNAANQAQASIAFFFPLGSYSDQP